MESDVFVGCRIRYNITFSLISCMWLMLWLICGCFNVSYRSMSVMALELKAEEFGHYVGVVHGAREVVQADMTQADPFLESKPRDANVACARCRLAVICHVNRGDIVYINWYTRCLSYTEVVQNASEI